MQLIYKNTDYLMLGSSVIQERILICVDGFYQSVKNLPFVVYFAPTNHKQIEVYELNACS